MRHSSFKTIDHRKILLPLIHLSYLNIFDNIDLSIQVIKTLTFVISQKSMNGLTFLNIDGGWLDGNGRDRITTQVFSDPKAPNTFQAIAFQDISTVLRDE